MKFLVAFKNFRAKVLFGFIIFAAVFFTIDWLSKHFFFEPEHVDWQNNGAYIVGTEADYGIIGVRSVAHDNSTIFSAFRVRIPEWAHFLLNFVVCLIFILIPFFTKNLFLGVACGIVFAGVLGNSLDKVVSTWSSEYSIFAHRSFVRDVFYIPWFDRGTFNFADVAIITGSIMLIAHVLITNIRDLKAKKVPVKVEPPASNDQITESDQE